MCTTIAWQNGDLYLGRTMDIAFDFPRHVVITPRNYPFHFAKHRTIERHHALIGTAMLLQNHPLYCEAVNEMGLYMAGLNFPGLARYAPPCNDKPNICAGELIAWVLCQCRDLAHAEALLAKTHVTNLPIADGVAVPDLHFLLADQTGSRVLEYTAQGMTLFDNPTGVMTNNPDFPMHMQHLNNFRALSPRTPPNTLTQELHLPDYCVGLGGLGLPGDYSSPSRFVKAFFLKTNAAAPHTPDASVAHMLHMLAAVSMPRGAVIDGAGNLDTTVYTCCIDAQRGVYYYKTYDSTGLQAVHLHHANLDGSLLNCFAHQDDCTVTHHN